MRRQVFAILAAAAPAIGFADTPYSIDVSDLWWNPAESGWGLNLEQQSGTVFATMFVYGPDRKAHWYSASEMNGSFTSQGVGFSGRLVEATGPTQPGNFIASEVVRRDVGSITFQTRGDNAADLTYTVNGVTVNERVQRFTMKATNASGEYVGSVARKGCNADNTAATIRVVQTPSSFSMVTTTRGSSMCTYTGTPQQRGRILDVTGTFSCNFGRAGSFELSNANVTFQGFLGHLSETGMSCNSEARIGGVSNEGSLAARSSVDISDLWWDPNESGWGINFEQQDDLAFATLFTYGVGREPKWYSASDLRMGFVLPGGLPSFDGTLYESTGPSFDTSFNPATVTRRAVGEIHFDPVTGHPDQGQLMYYVDGVQYLKQVKRYTMRQNDASGSYLGSHALRNTCSGGGTAIFNEPVTFTIAPSNGSFSMNAVTANQNCTYTGSSEQRGRMLWSEGTYSCGGNLPESGNYRIKELEVGQEGVIGQIQRGGGSPELFDFGGCVLTGRIVGVRPY